MLFVNQARRLFLSVYVDDIKMAGLTEKLGQIWKMLMKDVDHHSWITYFWDVLKENVQSAMKLTKIQRCG